MTEEDTEQEHELREPVKQLVEKLYESLDAYHTAIFAAEEGREARSFAAMGGQLSRTTQLLDELEEEYELVEDVIDEVESDREDEIEAPSPGKNTDENLDIFG